MTGFGTGLGRGEPRAVAHATVQTGRGAHFTVYWAALRVVGNEHPDLHIGLIYNCHSLGRDLGFKPDIHLGSPTKQH